MKSGEPAHAVSHAGVGTGAASVPQRRATDLGGDAAAVSHVPSISECGAEVSRRAQGYRHGLAIADVVAATVAILVLTVLERDHVASYSVLLAPLVVLVAKLGGLYDRDELVLTRTTVGEVPQLVRLAITSGLIVWCAQDHLARGALAELVLVLLVAVVAARSVARAAVLRAFPEERCLLVGDPATADRVAAKLDARHAVLVGFLPIVERRRRPPGAPPHDPAVALAAAVARCRAHRIIVAPGPHADSDETLRVVSRAKELGAQVSILPRLFEVVGSSVEFDHLDGVVMLGVRRFGLSRSSRRIKRATDLVVASAALAAAAPIMLVAALAIRLETKGPVLYRQPRVGRSGQTFEMLKFRSMVHGADQVRAELAALAGGEDGLFKLAADPRVTRVGRVLRRFSLDELPQLLNVLRGEMSIVGPRPLIADEDRQIEGWHRRRLELTPGMTGPWQVLGDSQRRVPLRDMVTIDYLYAANWSLWADVKILLWTVRHVLGGRGV